MKKVSRSSEQRRLKEYLEKLKLIKQYDQVDYQESSESQQLRISRAKKDYAFFVESYFPHYATSKCADFHIKIARKVKADQRLRAVIEMFRGAAKSTHFDVFIPIWLHLFHKESMFMVLVSESETHATRLLDDLRAELEANPQLIHDFGTLKSNGEWQEGEFSTTTGAHFIARGKKSPSRGLRKGNLRPTLIVLDDVDDDEEVKNPKRVKESIKRIKRATRLSQDIGIARFIIVNNRIADFCILSEFAKNPKYWHLRINALDEQGNPSWPEKYTREYYEDLREELGPIDFDTELMNSPTTEGEIFKEEYFQKKPPRNLNHYERIVAFWDVAYSESKSADYNAVPIVGRYGKEKHLLAGFCRQAQMDEAIRWMRRFDMALPKTVTVEWYAESQFYNESVRLALDRVAQEEEFAGHSWDVIFKPNPREQKYSRIIKMLPDMQRREFFISSKMEHDVDVQTIIKQTKGIEPGYSGNDDGPDALQQCFAELQQDSLLQDYEPQLGNLAPSDKIY